MIQHYTEHAKLFNNMHASTILRKISKQFRDGQMIQILLLTVQKYDHINSANVKTSQLNRGGGTATTGEA